jgi:sugar transferase (PEP-CTERM/EpsH1 system associated)
VSDLLFLAHRIPWPPDKGDKIRSWRLLDHLLGRGWRVHLGAFVDDPADMAHEAHLAARCASVFLQPIRPAQRPWRGMKALLGGVSLSQAFYHDARMHDWVARTVAAHDVRAVVGFSGQMAPYLLAHADGRATIMDLVDMDSAKWGQYAAETAGPKRWLFAREARRLLELERAVAARADATLFVSEAEARLFRSHAPEAADRVRAVPNGVDMDYFDPDAGFPRQPVERYALDGQIVTFVGAMDYRPNAEGIAWFAREAWPAVRRARPGARLFVVGGKPPAEVQALLGRDGITVTGRVADVRPYIAAARAVVAPLRIARGVQNKVLEAMAMARPVVATPQAFEGIDAEPGRHLLVEAEADGMAAQVSRLLGDPASGQALGRAARARCLAQYRWSTNLSLLDGLLGGPSPAREREAA